MPRIRQGKPCVVSLFHICLFHRCFPCQLICRRHAAKTGGGLTRTVCSWSDSAISGGQSRCIGLCPSAPWAKKQQNRCRRSVPFAPNPPCLSARAEPGDARRLEPAPVEHRRNPRTATVIAVRHAAHQFLNRSTTVRCAGACGSRCIMTSAQLLKATAKAASIPIAEIRTARQIRQSPFETHNPVCLRFVFAIIAHTYRFLAGLAAIPVVGVFP